MADCSDVVSATQEACQAELEMAEAMCSSSSSGAGPAAAVPDVQPGRPMQEHDWQEVVYKVSKSYRLA